MFRSVLNTTLLVVVILACIGREVAAAGATVWHYSDAANWADDFPTCGGTQQSPVNIDSSAAGTAGFPTIEFYNYDVLPEEQTVTNDGHTLKVEFTSISETPYIAWGGNWFNPRVQYNFALYHLHWGSDSNQGSEHTIDSASFPMELHLVHFNNEYDSLGAAVTESDGLAVLGIMFEISSNDNPALAPLLEAAADVQDYNSDPTSITKPDMYALLSLLPSNTKSFYRYQGSLTTPTCNEAVLWTVFKEPIEVSESQMEEFRALIGLDGPTEDNFRPVQDLNGREVLTTSD